MILWVLSRIKVKLGLDGAHQNRNRNWDLIGSNQAQFEFILASLKLYQIYTYDGLIH